MEREFSNIMQKDVFFLSAKNRTPHALEKKVSGSVQKRNSSAIFFSVKVDFTGTNSFSPSSLRTRPTEVEKGPDLHSWWSLDVIQK